MRPPAPLCLLAPALALLLSACAAVGPDYAPPQAPAPIAWRNSAEAPSRVVDSALERDWWTLFQDPVLNELQARLEQGNPDLRIAALRVAQARASRDVAGAAWAPSVDARAGVQRQRSSETGSATRMIDAIGAPNRDSLVERLSEPYSLYQAGFDAAWELDLWGRVRRAVEAADARVEASVETREELRLVVLAELARNYLELAGVKRQRELAAQEVATGRELLELVEQRVRGGLGTEADSARQRALLAQGEARSRQLDEQWARALNRIALLLGERPEALDAGVVERVALPALPSEIPLGLPADAVRRRPDVQRSEALLHAATADIGVAMADLYPRIGIGASVGLESLHGGDLLAWASRTWMLGPRVSLPLFDGGRRRATVTLRELGQREAAEDWQRTVLAAWHELDDGLTSYGSEQARHRQLLAARDASRDAWRLAGIRYDHGDTDFLGPLDARRQWLQSERELAASEVRLRTLVVALYKATGGSGAPPP